MIPVREKALSKLIKESRPRAGGWRCCTIARRRDETSINTSVSPQPVVIPTPQATRNPPPLPLPYKTGLKLAMRRREHHTCHSSLSLPPPHPACALPPPPHSRSFSPHPKHLKPRVDTDGEGRRNPARLCTTAVRCVGWPPLNHRPPPRTNTQEHVYQRRRRRGAVCIAVIHPSRPLLWYPLLPGSMVRWWFGPS